MHLEEQARGSWINDPLIFIMTDARHDPMSIQAQIRNPNASDYQGAQRLCVQAASGCLHAQRPLCTCFDKDKDKHGQVMSRRLIRVRHWRRAPQRPHRRPPSQHTDCRLAPLDSDRDDSDRDD